MLTSSLHTNQVMRVFMLIYLLLIASSGNAFFWCQNAEAASHLEANLSGSCWTPCPSESNRQHCEELPTDENTAFSSAAGDCLDSPALASIITPAKQNSPKNKVAVADIETPDAAFILATAFNAEGLLSPSITQNLPARQALTALQTIVLLQ